MIEPSFWRDRRVFLTGHTGFKGAWMALVLKSMGAEVSGFSLPPEHDRGIFVAARIADDVHHHLGDIREYDSLRTSLGEAEPSVVIHMAAQALVRRSYVAPVETYATNVMGTVHLLEAVRQQPTVKAVVVVTSDKVYENVNWSSRYREGDHLGGHDPYSNSKACTELVADSYRRCFFCGDRVALVATGRAGNVIGGGDWAQDRLVPDAIRAFSTGLPLAIRHPGAVRPWQHVLDPVLGYLLLAERLVKEGDRFAGAWNFGPCAASEVPVENIVQELVRAWGEGASWTRDVSEHPHEATYLKLDSSKATHELGWAAMLRLEQALSLTVEWYKAEQRGADMKAVSLDQIHTVLSAARASVRC
ncbi:CDP-glucose 4,6-dehydratase [Bradyrhizobium sp. PMVTL-01]|uniref:CDP-glucose 4,6-dehydratase n=1 Tax=Bradyrhizobium sp. PMVTL-01 TaxID=3434999 RepID=UPI003F70592A